MNTSITPTRRVETQEQDGSPLSAKGPVLVTRAQAGASAVDEFGSEVELSATALAEAGSGGSTKPENRRRTIALAAAVVLLAALGTVGFLALPRTSTSRLAVDSTPAGAEVLVDGVLRGVTPLELDVPPGQPRIVVRAGTTKRELSLTIRAGETVRQHVELPATGVAAAPALTAGATGVLEVTSDPSRVPLLVDGAAAGTTPLSATTIGVGEHVLSARFPSGVVEQRIVVEAGRTKTLHLVSRAEAPGAVVGWLSLRTPLPLRITEEGRLLGTSDVDRVMLPVGTHALSLTNEETGFETSRTVTVTAGRPTLLDVAVPNANISVNARPWAEVFVDGERVGETPIGNIARTIGRHEIVLRHPELGERRQTVVLTLRAPTRVSVDFQQR